MKKSIFLLLLWIVFAFPADNVHAQDYTLKEGKETKAEYAGVEEDAYNYFKIIPSKSGYAEIKVKTANGEDLSFDICDGNKQVMATGIVVKNKKSVLHKVSKGQTYYVRTKGTEGQTHTISYKVNTFETLTYAKKYSYTFTNASLSDSKNTILLKCKAKETGNMSFMCNTDDNIALQFLDSKKKALSENSFVKEHSLTGIGVKKNNTYYIKLWRMDEKKDGTTTINDMKYQIRKINLTSNDNRKKAKNLSNGKAVETLLLAGKKTTTWYKIKLSKKKKINMTFESRLFQNSGQGMKIYICNEKGKALHTEPIFVTEKASSYYKKKYKMEYPRKIITTGNLPAGNYYVKVTSDHKMTSGSYKISWK